MEGLGGRRRRRGVHRLGVRLVGGMLVVSLPVMVGLALLLTKRSSDSLTEASHAKSASLANAVAVRLDDWANDRRTDLGVVAGRATAQGIADPDVESLLADVGGAYDDFDALVIADLSGRVIAATGEPGTADPAGSEWLPVVMSGQPVITSPTERDGMVEWVVASPVFDATGRPAGAVIGYLDVALLADLLNPDLDESTNVAAIDAGGVLVYDTAMGDIADGSALLAAGGLQSSVDNEATREAAAAGAGTARYEDPDGQDVIGGSSVAASLGWTVLAQEDTSHSLAPVDDQRVLAVQVVVIGTLLVIGMAVLFARNTTRPIGRLTAAARRAEAGDLTVRVEPSGSDELIDLGASFNATLDALQSMVGQLVRTGVEASSAASELSAASDELAATTTQQSAAVTEASATTEELARSAAAIADTVDELAGQAADTLANLQKAQVDVQTSNERTMALADRVNDIGALLVLINEIADQTGLLSLNAAIEAARAGEDGRGFAVVAEEVRRLAESSKASARDIAAIVEGIHAETDAMVMAMEQRAKRMQQGLALIDAVTDATDQVRLTTQQQRSATAQVVETMEQLTDASRQVSVTAQQIAGAAGSLADLAGNLEQTATAIHDGGRRPVGVAPSER